MYIAVGIAVNGKWFPVSFHSDAHDVVLSINRKLSPSWDYQYVLQNLSWLRFLYIGLVLGFLGWITEMHMIWPS